MKYVVGVQGISLKICLIRAQAPTSDKRSRFYARRTAGSSRIGIGLFCRLFEAEDRVLKGLHFLKRVQQARGYCIQSVTSSEAYVLEQIRVVAAVLSKYECALLKAHQLYRRIG